MDKIVEPSHLGIFNIMPIEIIVIILHKLKWDICPVRQLNKFWRITADTLFSEFSRISCISSIVPLYARMKYSINRGIIKNKFILHMVNDCLKSIDGIGGWEFATREHRIQWNSHRDISSDEYNAGRLTGYEIIQLMTPQNLNSSDTLFRTYLSTDSNWINKINIETLQLLLTSERNYSAFINEFIAGSYSPAVCQLIVDHMKRHGTPIDITRVKCSNLAECLLNNKYYANSQDLYFISCLRWSKPFGIVSAPNGCIIKIKSLASAANFTLTSNMCWFPKHIDILFMFHMARHGTATTFIDNLAAYKTTIEYVCDNISINMPKLLLLELKRHNLLFKNHCKAMKYCKFRKIWNRNEVTDLELIDLDITHIPASIWLTIDIPMVIKYEQHILSVLENASARDEFIRKIYLAAQNDRK